MSKFNQAKRIVKKVRKFEAKSKVLAEKVEFLFKSGRITKDEYNSLAD